MVPENHFRGLSAEPDWLENIHDVAYFYLDFLEQLDLRNVTLVGSSMGGWIAMELAVRDTARLKSLVLVSPAGIAAPGVLPADIFLMAPEDLVRNLFVDGKLVQARLSAPVDVDETLKNRHTTARLAWEPRLHDPFLPKWLHRIDVPVKIIWGKQDRILPVGILDELKRLMPNAKTLVLDDCGHLPHAEQVDEFVDFVCK